MPNYCENELTLYGTMEALKKFHFENKSDEDTDPESDNPVLCFGKSVPFPKDRNEDEEWFAWRVSHWGTKWECIG